MTIRIMTSHFWLVLNLFHLKETITIAGVHFLFFLPKLQVGSQSEVGQVSVFGPEGRNNIIRSYQQANRAKAKRGIYAQVIETLIAETIESAYAQ